MIGSYAVYISSDAPASYENLDFSSGDIWLQTHEVASARCERSKKANKSDMKKYLKDGVVSYYDGDAWNVVDSKEKDPGISHPQSGSFRIDLERLSWRSKNSFSSGSSWINKAKKIDETSDAHGFSGMGSINGDEEVTGQEAGNGQKDVRDIGHSENDLPRLSCFENEWILDLYKEWTSIPISYIKPTQVNGMEALRLLVEFREHLPKRPLPTSKIVLSRHELMYEVKPTDLDVLRDLVSMKEWKGVDVVTQSTPGTINGAEIYRSLLYAGDREWTEDDSLLTAFNLPSENLMTCGIKIPEEISSEQPNVVHQGESGANGQDATWESIICPRGALTPCHVDDWVVSIFIGHLTGKKLWLFWPPTPKNISTYTTSILSDDPQLKISDGIRSLTGLEVLLLDEEQLAWVMVPGTIHAVITFSKIATHTSFFMISSEHLPIAQTTSKEVLTCIRRLNQNGNSPGTKDADNFLESLATNGLPCWKGLADKMKKKKSLRRQAKEIEGWVEDVKEGISMLAQRRPWMKPNQELNEAEDTSNQRKRSLSKMSSSNSSNEQAKKKKLPPSLLLVNEHLHSVKYPYIMSNDYVNHPSDFSVSDSKENIGDSNSGPEPEIKTHGKYS
ncbi:hypothetical protein BDZ97DRAFT_1924122 [Flammula alnicola]|nr:hypothetical protein BDZ97DRAFT_1924122 [Flammula alnicola]